MFAHNDEDLVALSVIGKISFLTEDDQMYTMLENFINDATKQGKRHFTFKTVMKHKAQRG